MLHVSSICEAHFSEGAGKGALVACEDAHDG